MGREWGQHMYRDTDQEGIAYLEGGLCGRSGEGVWVEHVDRNTESRRGSHTSAPEWTTGFHVWIVAARYATTAWSQTHSAQQALETLATASCDCHGTFRLEKVLYKLDEGLFHGI